MDKFDVYKEARNLIASDKLEEAVKVLIQHFDSNHLLQQFGRLSSVKNQIINGTISFSEAEIEKNKIRIAILSIANECINDYDKLTKNRINSKLEYFFKILQKKTNKTLVLIFFLLGFCRNLLKKIALGFTALILTVVGISFYIEQKTNEYIIISDIEKVKTIQQENIKTLQGISEGQQTYIDRLEQELMDCQRRQNKN